LRLNNRNGKKIFARRISIETTAALKTYVRARLIENKIEIRSLVTLGNRARSAECGKWRKLLVPKTRRDHKTPRQGEIARVASNETSCDESFVARVRADTSLSLSLSFCRGRGAEERENAVENIRFPREAGELSSLKVGGLFKARSARKSESQSETILNSGLDRRCFSALSAIAADDRRLPLANYRDRSWRVLRSLWPRYLEIENRIESPATLMVSSDISYHETALRKQFRTLTATNSGDSCAPSLSVAAIYHPAGHFRVGHDCK